MATPKPSPLIKGTSTTVRFSRVVDGDTIRIYPPGTDKDESVRILSLDTEETSTAANKPVTPWGRKATEFAKEFFKGATEVVIEFPGNDPLDVAFDRYRGNFGRLLVFVYLNGVDFQQVMIRRGYSPYYNKYGNANFQGHHLRYVQAERQAQVERIGVWDQIAVNGSVMRNYASLQVWWNLRASIIDEYRAIKAVDATVYNSRLDYAKLKELAQEGGRATVFTEVRSIRVVAGSIGLIGIGSFDRPFNLKIDDVDSEIGQRLVNLLRQRYISESEDIPRRGYCYATGRMEMYRDIPQLVLAGPQSVTDSLAMRAEVEGSDRDTVMTPVVDDREVGANGGAAVAESGGMRIVSLLPDPAGDDRGNETVTLRNGRSSEVDLTGWILRDAAGRKHELKGRVAAGDSIVVTLGAMVLNNGGDVVFLVDSAGSVVNRVEYAAGDVVTGKSIDFE